MRKLLLTLLVLFFAVGPAVAAENFMPANREGQPAASEYKSRKPHEKADPSKPKGFWAKEYERSGLKESRQNGWKNVKDTLNVPGWLKKKEDAYKARNAGGATK